MEILEGDSYETEEKRERLKTLELKKSNVLLDREELWRLKIQAIWLSAGDENTNFF